MTKPVDPLDLPPWWCRDERCSRDGIHPAHEIAKRRWRRKKPRPSRFAACPRCSGAGCRECNGSGIVPRRRAT